MLHVLRVLRVVLPILRVVLPVLRHGVRLLPRRVWLLRHHLLLAQQAVHAVQAGAAAGAVPGVAAGDGAAAAAAAAAARGAGAGATVVCMALAVVALPWQGAQEVVVLLVVKARGRRRQVVGKNGVQERVGVCIVQVAERGGWRVVQVRCRARGGPATGEGRGLGGSQQGGRGAAREATILPALLQRVPLLLAHQRRGCLLFAGVVGRPPSRAHTPRPCRAGCVQLRASSAPVTRLGTASFSPANRICQM